MELWEKLHLIADKANPQFQLEFIKSIHAVQKTVNLRRLREAIKSGNASLAWKALDWDAVMKENATPRLTNAIGDMVESAGEAVMKDLISVDGAFDVQYPQVIDAVNKRAANLVTHITEQTRKAITDAVREAFLQGKGVPKEKIFTELEAAANIRDDLGLNRRQMASLDKYRQSIAGKGITGARYDKMVSRYRWSLLKARAAMIARTETIEAACEGQRLAWDQAVADGHIDKKRWEVEWIVTPDDITCDRCKTMLRAKRPIDGVYTTGQGSGTKGPTLHPNCRCGERLVKKQGGIAPVKNPTPAKTVITHPPKLKPVNPPTPAPPPAPPKPVKSAREQSYDAWQEKKVAVDELRASVKKAKGRELSELYQKFNEAKAAERSAYYRYVPHMTDAEYLTARTETMNKFFPSGTYGSDRWLADGVDKRIFQQGTDWIPLDVLDGLAESGIRVQYQRGAGRAFFNGESKSVHLYSSTVDPEVVGHEFSHGIDWLFSKDTPTGFGGRFGFQWQNNIYTSKKEGYALEKTFQKTHYGTKGTFDNGDGEYWKDNWIKNYEGRIYPGSGPGIEWWSMNCQRFTSYQQHLKQYDKMLAIKKEAVDYVSKREVEDLLLAGREGWAERMTEWGLAKKRYPELTKFIEDKFGYNRRLMGRK